MAGKFKCTYDDCFRHFDSEEAMKAHKSKDRAHESYCKRCDKDCRDDEEYLLHQITSKRHLCCPICGMEFKSQSGLARHVDTNHPRKQKIPCAGCSIVFSSAAALMSHIERGECEAIEVDEYRKHRAEKTMEKVTPSDHRKAGQGTSSAAAASITDRGDSTVNFLEHTRVHHSEQRGPGPLNELHDDVRNDPVDQLGPLANQILDFSDAKFPPLHPESMADSMASSAPRVIDAGDDLLSFEQRPDMRRDPQFQSTPDSNSHNKKASYSTVASSVSTDLLGFSEISGDRKKREPKPYDWSSNQSEVDHSAENSAYRHYDFSAGQSTVNQAPPLMDPQPRGQNHGPVGYEDSRSNRDYGGHGYHSRQSSIPPAAKPVDRDPNSFFVHIRTIRKRDQRAPINLRPYWNPLEARYNCPGFGCRASCATSGEFERHLLSDVHQPKRVQCPSCLKTFNSTPALVAHCESGSRRCNVRNTGEYDVVMNKVTAGLVKVNGHNDDGSVRFTAVPMHEWADQEW